jgi:MoaA/NifB/PqqE/SkfB family radical SAM enzyme
MLYNMDVDIYLLIAIGSEKMIESKETHADYINPLNKALRVFFKDAVTVSLKNPGQAAYFLNTLKNLSKATRTRAKLKKQGLQVPPMMIISITNRCNLHCKGCFHQVLRDVSRSEMSDEKLRNVIAEANDLGISFIVLAGGEPLVRRDILEITRDFPEVIFLMFTNGLLISDEILRRFKKQKNIVPLLSIEGYEEDTDGRRGNGVYQRLQTTIEKLKKQDIFFGTSITLTRHNFETVTHAEFISGITKIGCKLLLFAEFTPVKPGTEEWVISGDQRKQLDGIMSSFRSQYSALFVSVPGDEKDFGGCLSAGRGFIHISAEGDVEPCPFAPYSVTNIQDSSLKEALQSDFLKAIRENKELVKETGGGCALFAKRQWVQAALTSSKNNHLKV